MRLSPHFTLREMAGTSHRSLMDANLEESRSFIDPLRALCSTLLEPVRARFGAPVVIHSGFRGDTLNQAVGGSTTSQHPKGEAADFRVVGVPLVDVWMWIARDSGLPFGQLILEGYAAGEPSWIHLSLGAPWRPAAKCGQVMKASVDPVTRQAKYHMVQFP